MVWLFPNDVFSYTNSTTLGGGIGGFDGTPGVAGPIPPADLIANAVNNITSSISELAGKGARNFLVVNTPDLGLIPELLGADPADKTFLSALSNGFNASLSSAVSGVAASKPELDITYFEIDNLFAEVQSNPGAFGLTNAVDRCLGNPECQDPSEYLFWDGSHPTTAGHELIGQRFFEAVYAPVPGPLPAAGVVVVLGWSRRMRSRIRRGEAYRLQASEPKNQP